MSGPTIPGMSLSGADALIRELGGDVELVAAASRLPLTVFSDVELTVDLRSGLDFLEQASRLTRDDDFGLLLAKRQDFSVLGPLYAIMMLSSTIGDALGSLVRFLLLYSSGLLVTAETVDEGLRIDYSTHADGVERDRQAVELGLGLLANFVRRHSAEPWQPVYVQFRHSRPQHFGEHVRAFGENVFFDQDRNALCIDRRTLGAALYSQASPSGLVRSRIMRLHGAFGEKGLVPRTEAALRALLPYGMDCTIGVVATQIGMSVRTLQRGLANAGVCFESIRDKVRADLASRYLRQSAMPISEISAVLGYSQPSAFTRSFRRLHGCAPLAFRRRVSTLRN